jgi:hypothetical protein
VPAKVCNENHDDRRFRLLMMMMRKKMEEEKEGGSIKRMGFAQLLVFDHKNEPRVIYQ